MGVSEAPAPARRLIKTARQRYRMADGPLLVFVGSLVEEKGVDDLIEAVAILSSHLPNVTSLVIGDGPLARDLRSLAAALGVADRIAFPRWVEPSELPVILAAADVFVGPSKQIPNGGVEAQSLTFLEAMLYGLPVIATEVGGIVDAIRHEQTGLLVPPNSPEDIAQAVERLTTTPSLGATIAAAGQDLVRRDFTRRHGAAQFSRLFERLMTGRQEGRCKEVTPTRSSAETRSACQP